MSHTYTITVIHNGETVQVYPQRIGRERLGLGTDFGEVCQRVGMMVMSSGITQITVHRDGKLYRQADVTYADPVMER